MSVLSSRQPAARPGLPGAEAVSKIEIDDKRSGRVTHRAGVELLDVIFELAPHHSIVNSMIYI